MESKDEVRSLIKTLIEETKILQREFESFPLVDELMASPNEDADTIQKKLGIPVEKLPHLKELVAKYRQMKQLVVSLDTPIAPS